jgi:hypothetical protein
MTGGFSPMQLKKLYGAALSPNWSDIVVTKAMGRGTTVEDNNLYCSAGGKALISISIRPAYSMLNSKSVYSEK